MDYFPFIQSIVIFIENRISELISYEHIEQATGLSYAHVRNLFKEGTNISIGKYISERKISHGAYRLIHSDKSILEIALDLGFECHDTFTRSFRRVTGVNPRDFRRRNNKVGRRMITSGIFGPSLNVEHSVLNPILKDLIKQESSCILYGVDKVSYEKEFTPFPACLKSVLNYMGQSIDYQFLMAASGASFRLRWRKPYWDGGNVDIMYIYENPWEVFERTFKAAGREYSIIKRTDQTKKDDFIKILRHEIDNGRPLIAIGIIGPPEACIITGYRDNGETLLGWNFFQEMKDFSKDTLQDESGYFVTKSWWENPDTTALMSIGEKFSASSYIEDLLMNAVSILTNESINSREMKDVACGQAAFDAWESAILDEQQFNDSLPVLFERLMCQVDAMTMIGEGRLVASSFIRSLSKDYPEEKKIFIQTADLLKKEAETVDTMGKVLEGFAQGEKQARNLQKREVRLIIAEEIRKAKQLESQVVENLQQILDSLMSRRKA